MKKIALLSAVALGLAFTACDDTDIIDIPQNPAPVEFNVEDLTITAGEQLSEVLDLKALAENFQSIAVADVQVPNFPEDYEVSVVMQMSADQSFAKVCEVPAAVSNNQIVVSPEDLQEVYQSNISKSPKQRTVYARYAAYAVKDQSTVRLGNPDYYWGSSALNILPMPSNLVIEQNYYLLGTCNGWSVAEALPLTHSDKDVYDDPTFSIVVNITPAQAAEGWWWKIVPESTKATGNWVDGDNASFGVAENGSEELSGMLIGRTATADCGAGCLKVAGPYRLTINLEEGTYSFQFAVENLYTPGDANGWNQGNSQLLFTTDYANYMGFAYASSVGFKFSTQADWGGINYGDGGAEGKLSEDGGAGNLTVAETGLYWFNANLPSLEYTATKINTIGLIGDATPKGWDASTALTPSENGLVWTGTVTMAGTGEYKFRANDDWAVNLGGSADDLQPNASNIATPGAGTYTVTLDLRTLPYKVTFVK